MSKQDEDIAAVKQLMEDWGAGWSAGDADALVALLADEPAIIMSSETPITGKEDIRTLYQHVFENYSFTSDDEFVRTSEGEEIELVIDGDLGYVWSSYQNTETPRAGGETLEDHGNIVIIVRRQQDGSWKVSRVIAIRS